MSKIEKTPVIERVAWAARQGQGATVAISAAFDALRDCAEHLSDYEEAACLRGVSWERAEAELPSVHFAGAASQDADGKPRSKTTRREPRETDERAHRIEVGIARGMLREAAHAAAFCTFEALFAMARGRGTQGEAKRKALDYWRMLGKHEQCPESASARDLVRVSPAAETALGKALAAATAGLTEYMGEGRGFAGLTPRVKKGAGKGVRYMLSLPTGKLRFPADAVPAFLKQALQEQPEVAVTLTLKVGADVFAVDGRMVRDGQPPDEAKPGEPSHGPVVSPTDGVIAPAQAA